MVIWNWPLDPTQRAQQLDAKLSNDQRFYLSNLALEAEKLNYPLYIVGGFVRDILLGIVPSDLDLVVEGDALILAEEFKQIHGGDIVLHKRFKTANIKVPSIEHTGSEVIFDLVSSRSEIYEKPGSLPSVKISSLRDDLLRRDFSINTLAIRLDGQYRGEYRDDLNGISDLQKGIVRILHQHSFRDDPTRIFRAARYVIRYNFLLSDETAQQIYSEREFITNLSAKRLRHELDLIMNDDKAGLMMMQLAEWEILKIIHPDLLMRNSDLRRMNLAYNVNEEERKKYRWTLWLLGQSVSTLEQIDERLHFPSDIRKIIRSASELYHSIESYQDIRPSEFVKKLANIPFDSIHTVWLILPEGRIKKNFENYLGVWRYVKPNTTGKNLEKLGVPPGPKYQIIFERLRDSWLDGLITTNEEEHNLLQSIIRELDNG